MREVRARPDREQKAGLQIEEHDRAVLELGADVTGQDRRPPR
jgi:hypothetical protein